MKKYTVSVTKKAKEKLRKYLCYLKDVKKNPQAAKNVMQDFRETRKELEAVAGSLKEPENAELKQAGLKRINFRRHNYFLLYRIEGNKAIIITMFHSLEDPDSYLE